MGRRVQLKQHGVSGWVWLVVGALAAVAGLGGGMASCGGGGGGGGAALSATCSINSDCDSPLICAFGRCHAACAASRDCDNGERCVIANGVGSCQLAVEASCSGGATCASDEVCGADMQCRGTCTPVAGGCAQGDYCLPSGTVDACYSPTTPDDEPTLITDGILGADGAVVSEAGSDATMSTPNDAGGTGDAAALGPVCATAQTQFGNIAAGDPNPGYTSGIGARTEQQLLIFDSYVGPDPNVDSQPIGIVYVQAFDPTSAASAGAATRLFDATNLNTPGENGVLGFTFMSSAIAPTGEIVLVYSVHFSLASGSEIGLYATFLAPSSGDAGGLSVTKTLLLETATLYGQPHAFWSDSTRSFVLSWTYESSGAYVKMQRYTVAGAAAGGVSAIPTDDPTARVVDNGSIAESSVAESGNLFGLAYSSNIEAYKPGLSVIDPSGVPVGVPFVDPSLSNPSWTEVGGTPQGFVYFYDNAATGGVDEFFFAASPDAGVAGGVSDASTVPQFAFSGGARANVARAIGDNMRGQNGVGVALLFSNGASFAYVNADGVGHVGPNSVISSSVGSGDIVSMTTLDGSYVVSLYTAANHSTQLVASSCPQ